MRIDWEEYTTDEFLALDRELTAFYFHSFGADSERYVGYNGVDACNDFFIAFEGTVPVGIVCFKPFALAQTAEIKRLFVGEEYRGKGYGKALLQKAEEGALRKGYRHAVITTRATEKNAHAQEFYKKNGYAVVENFPPFEEDRGVLTMKKDL